MTLLLATGVVLLLVGLAFFYVSSRMQFVLFDVVLRRTTTIAPVWRRYGGLTWRWIGVKLLFFFCTLLGVGAIAAPVFMHFLHPAQHGAQPAQDSGVLFATLAGFIVIAVVAVLLFVCAYVFLADFGLPSLALDNLTTGQTFHRVVELFRAEPGAFLLYLLMRFVILLAGTTAAYLVLGLSALVLLVPLGLAALLLWALLRHAAPAGHLAMIAGWGVLGFLLAAALMCAAAIALGYLYTFVQAYALYFLAGRYPRLAEILLPDPPQLWPAPPPAPFAAGPA